MHFWIAKLAFVEIALGGTHLQYSKLHYWLGSEFFTQFGLL